MSKSAVQRNFWNSNPAGNNISEGGARGSADPWQRPPASACRPEQKNTERFIYSDHQPVQMDLLRMVPVTQRGNGGRLVGPRVQFGVFSFALRTPELCTQKDGTIFGQSRHLNVPTGQWTIGS